MITRRWDSAMIGGDPQNGRISSIQLNKYLFLNNLFIVSYSPGFLLASFQ